MYQTFIAPTETPPSSLAIKRALLTYDKVILSDPGDRDYFPPQLFMQAMSAGLGFPLPFGMNMGPVRALGKVNAYDDMFDQLMDEIEYARRQSIVDVVSTYDRSTEKGMTIGAVPTGGYPLNPSMLLWWYRNIARDQEALSLAISEDHLIGKGTAEMLVTLGGEKSSADGKINNDPALPLMEAELARPELREVISKIARSRIASVMKTVGFCASKEVAPTFCNSQYANILNHMASRAARVVDLVAEDDPFLVLRNRVLELAHSEYVNDEVLSELSIDDVLKLRTRAWGEQAEARDNLLQSAATLALECKTADEFDAEVKSRISEYQNSWDTVMAERKRLGFNIQCDLVIGSSAVATSAVGGQLVGTLSHLQSGIGAATLLFAGCGIGAMKLKEYKHVHDQIVAAENEFGDHVCFGIRDFYRRLS